LIIRGINQNGDRMNILEKAKELTLMASEPHDLKEWNRFCKEADEGDLKSRICMIRWNDRATGAINHEHGPGVWTEANVFCSNDAPARDVVKVLFPREENQTIGSEIVYTKWWEMKVRPSEIPKEIPPYIIAAIQAGIDPRIGLLNSGIEVWIDEPVGTYIRIYARKDGLDAVIIAEGDRKEFNHRTDILYKFPQRRTFIPTT